MENDSAYAPSFNNKTKDRVGVGNKPPPSNFGRPINPNLIQFFFFHPTGYAPSFNNKTKDRVGVGNKPPPSNFGRPINPNLIQFFFFHPTGYLKINQN